MASWHRFGPYTSVALKEAKAERARRKLQKKNPNIRPVILQGRAIAQSWWGKAWCQNLERYADYAYRLERGRSYVRHGAVLDLQIAPGQIAALVQGSHERPYKVQIHIDRLGQSDWRHIRQACEGRIDSLSSLLAGEFPKTLGDIFMRQGQGLFPSPNEIHFECSCPDRAGMCKHVAAALYGVGVRLDETPALLFVLRQVSVQDLVSRAVSAASRKLLEKADAESNGSRVIAEADLSNLFGIDLEGPAPAKAVPERKRRLAKAAAPEPAADKKRKSTPPPAPEPPRRRRIVVSVPQAVVPAEPPKAARKPKRGAGAKTAASSPADTIVAIIQQSAQGVDTAALQQRTGLAVTVIRAAVYAALRKGLIRRVGWGLYKGA